jgi:hypothetical protein
MVGRLLAALLLVSGTASAVTQRYLDALKARIDKTYAVVLLANGSKTIVPLDSLKPDDREWLNKLSAESPLPRGKSEVKIVKADVKAKTTIVVSSTVGPLETVQLVPPNVPRDQIGGTCMLYARVHWLDIAGYYVDNVDIYKIINIADTVHPYTDPNYYHNMAKLMMGFNPRPVLHNWTPKEDAFEWTRQEIRKGRPVLAAFPREIWQALPPGFVGMHPWNGGSVGHQIVVNGFTWNRDTHEGTFHIVNSWKELPEFDLKTDMAKGAMVVEQSVSPKGEAVEEAVVTKVMKVVLIRSIGKTNLYEVDTSNGVERVAAPDAATARAMVAGADSTY